MAPGRLRPSNRTIIGVGLLLFAAVLIGYGLHHVIRTGTCSSTGYSANYGPVPHCPAGTGAWIGFLIGGIFVVIIGGLVAGRGAGLIIPGSFCGIGAGAFSVVFDSHASSGAKTFGLLFGGFFFLGGAVPGLLVLAAAMRGAFSATRAPAQPVMGPAAQPAAPAFQATPASEAEAAFGGSRDEPDAILGAYRAARERGGDPPPPGSAA